MNALNDIVDACVWGGVGAPLAGLAFALNAAARRDPVLDAALAQAECAYRLENRDGSRGWFLILRDGRAEVRRRSPWPPVSTLRFLRRRALLELRPESLLTAMIDNDVLQRGGTYALYRLGFIVSLLERRLPGRGGQTAAV